MRNQGALLSNQGLSLGAGEETSLSRAHGVGLPPLPPPRQSVGRPSPSFAPSSHPRGAVVALAPLSTLSNNLPVSATPRSRQPRSAGVSPRRDTVTTSGNA